MDPIPDPTQAAPPPAAAPPPSPDDLDALVDKLSRFDPDEVAQRLAALEQSAGGGDPPPWLDEIKQRLDELGAGLKSLLEPKKPPKQKADPPADPAPPPAQQQQPADSGVELHPPRGSMMSKLFDVPIIGGQA